jgi:hypothetical protein
MKTTSAGSNGFVPDLIYPPPCMTKLAQQRGERVLGQARPFMVEEGFKPGS